MQLKTHARARNVRHEYVYIGVRRAYTSSKGRPGRSVNYRATKSPGEKTRCATFISAARGTRTPWRPRVAAADTRESRGLISFQMLAQLVKRRRPPYDLPGGEATATASPRWRLIKRSTNRTHLRYSCVLFEKAGRSANTSDMAPRA